MMVTSVQVLQVLVLFAPLVQVSARCLQTGFTIKYVNECTIESFMERFEVWFLDPINRGLSCVHDAEQELLLLLDAANMEEAKWKLDDVCAQGFANSSSLLPFHTIAGYGPEFDSLYFNGGTYWNEEYATEYGAEEAEDRNGISQILREDASHIKSFYDGPGRYGLVEFPTIHSQFDDCEMNTMYCCWPQDRQANDNNGNCRTPYDVNCIDRDPADNTDLCYMETSTGELLFPLDDGNSNFVAEGAIHCHGLSWTEQKGDPSFAYRGNNLFYVSMYDHFHQRGYVRNIPGAPMCACAEQMPVVSRSDCTEMDVTHRLDFHFDGETLSMTVESIEIAFNACQGVNRKGQSQNNDLWSYANRLYQEGMFDESKLTMLTKKLVGEDNNACREAERIMMNRSSMTLGFNEGNQWVQLSGKDHFAVGSSSTRTPAFGPISARMMFASVDPVIIHRICTTCLSSHQHIFYRRLTAVPEAIDLTALLMTSTRQVEGNIWGVDFEMYSTYADAVAETNPWGCSGDSFSYGSGFPGDCSPTGARVRHQGSSSRRNVGLFLKAPSMFSATSSVNVGGYRGIVAGSAFTETGSPSTFHITSSAHGIVDETDEFQFAHRNLAGQENMVMSVRLEEFYGRGSWSSAGLMIRESLDPGARFFEIQMTQNYGVIVRYRTEAYGRNNYYSGEIATGEEAPIWFRVVKQGLMFTPYTSADGVEWTIFSGTYVVEGYTMEEFNTQSMVGGMTVTSYTTYGDMAEAVFSGFSHTAVEFPTSAPTTSPAPTVTNVVSTDVGNVGTRDYNFGSASYTPSRDVYHVTGGARTLIGGQVDDFHFAYFDASGDFKIEAFVEKIVPDTNGFAGIMIRDALEANAPNAFCFLSTGQGAYGSVRETIAANSDSVGYIYRRPDSPSAWLRLTKMGTTITFERSVDGVFWDVFGERTVMLGNQVKVGMVVTSGNSRDPATGSFRGWKITQL